MLYIQMTKLELSSSTRVHRQVVLCGYVTITQIQTQTQTKSALYLNCVFSNVSLLTTGNCWEFTCTSISSYKIEYGQYSIKYHDIHTVIYKYTLYIHKYVQSAADTNNQIQSNISIHTNSLPVYINRWRRYSNSIRCSIFTQIHNIYQILPMFKRSDQVAHNFCV